MAQRPNEEELIPKHPQIIHIHPLCPRTRPSHLRKRISEERLFTDDFNESVEDLSGVIDADFDDLLSLIKERKGVLHFGGPLHAFRRPELFAHHKP